MGSLKGLDDFERTLKSIGKDARTRIIPAALAEGLEAIRSEVHAEAPSGKTGELRSKIYIDRIHQTKGGASGAVSINSGHAAAVDFGTKDQRANRFLQRALRRVGQRIADSAARRIATRIEAEGK